MVTVKFELKCCPNKCNFSMLLLAGAGRRCSTRISMAYDALLCSALQAVVVREDGRYWSGSVWLVGWVRRISDVHMSIRDGRLSVFVSVVGWVERERWEEGGQDRAGESRAGQPRSQDNKARLGEGRPRRAKRRGGDSELVMLLAFLRSDGVCLDVFLGTVHTAQYGNFVDCLAVLPGFLPWGIALFCSISLDHQHSSTHVPNRASALTLYLHHTEGN